MILTKINRSILFAFQSFWRNIWLSLATIFVIFLTLISINFLISINAIAESAITSVKEKVDISIYFKQDVREGKIAEIKSHLETIPQVKNIMYSSPEDNLALFYERHKDNALIQETLDELEGNPLGATLVIKAKSLIDYPEVLKAVDNPAYADLIENKSYDDHQLVIERINSIATNIQRGGLIVSLIFGLIAVLIVFNTVRIAIFTHRSEIGIMKLVGANNWFIRAPFIIESIISTIIGLIIATIVIYPILSFIQPQLIGFFGGGGMDLIGYFNVNSIFIFGGQLLGMILLSVISSSLAVGRYLRV